MSEFEDFVAQMKQKRDELRVQMHLASKEIQDEWEELEEKMEEFSEKAKLEETGEALGQALSRLGGELKRGYARIKDAVKEP